jgi:uncharacterized metal-binding protein YceD (DUF177 family)
MVAVNVAQLLLAAPGSVREFDFAEPLPDPRDELHLHGPIRGHARLLRTSRGVLVHSEHVAQATLECARCLEAAEATIEGTLDEEFLATTDIRTGLPVDLGEPLDPDTPIIDEHHVIDLNEVLRQNVLTSLPLAPLCDAVCPGLCPTCGERLGPAHAPHPTDAPEATEAPAARNPFAALAGLITDEHED